MSQQQQPHQAPPPPDGGDVDAALRGLSLDGTSLNPWHAPAGGGTVPDAGLRRDGEAARPPPPASLGGYAQLGPVGPSGRGPLGGWPQVMPGGPPAPRLPAGAAWGAGSLGGLGPVGGSSWGGVWEEVGVGIRGGGWGWGCPAWRVVRPRPLAPSPTTPSSFPCLSHAFPSPPQLFVGRAPA